jgi:hypothetical protein
MFHSGQIMGQVTVLMAGLLMEARPGACTRRGAEEDERVAVGAIVGEPLPRINAFHLLSDQRSPRT